MRKTTSIILIGILSCIAAIGTLNIFSGEAEAEEDIICLEPTMNCAGHAGQQCKINVPSCKCDWMGAFCQRPGDP